MKVYNYLFLSLLVILFSSCAEDKKEVDSNKNNIKIVKFLNLKYSSSINSSVLYPAQIYPYKNVILAFEQSGKIIEFPYQVGDNIKKGSVIASLDSDIVKSNYNAAKASFQKARLDYKRFKKLYSLQSIAKYDLEKSRQNYDLKKSSYEIAKKNLNNTKIVAEFDGVLAKKFVEDYARIVAKQKIGLLQDTSKFKVKFFVPESDMLKLKGNLTIEHISEIFDFFVILGNQLKYKAVLEDVSTKAEDVTRTYEATVLFDKPQNVNILPGMTAKLLVKIKKESQDNISIPLKAVFSDNTKKSFVWAVDNNNKVHKKEVLTKRLSKDNIEIIAGLSKDDTIVVSGINLLQENQEVKEYKKMSN